MGRRAAAKRAREKMDPRKSAAYRLFHYWYSVWVPSFVTYNEKEIETWGMCLTGDDEVDKKMASELREYSYRGFELAILAEQGINFSFITPKDAVSLYRDICEHLADWGIESKYRRKDQVPLEGLKEFNTLAKKLVVVARNQYGYMPKRKKLNRRGVDLSKASLRNLADVEHDDSAINEIISNTATKVKRLDME